MTTKTSPWLLLGRVSNLPTVWSNVLAGVALASAAQAVHASELSAAHLIVLCIALSLLYVGGMYLNDAFDRRYDAQNRPERPIPSGAVSATAVLALGFGMLLSGAAIAGTIGFDRGQGGSAGERASLLAAVIVLYDLWHKNNPWSPVLMGACRVLVYATAAAAIDVRAEPTLLLPCLALLGYLIGLTYTAKHEGGGSVVKLWPLLPLLAPVAYGALAASALAKGLALVLLVHIALCLRLVLDPKRRHVPSAVTRFIAGISIVDAIAIAQAGAPVLWVALAIAGYAVTRLLQRVVPGT